MSSIDLAWVDTSSDEDSFMVERSTDGSSFSYVGQTGANATSYVDQSLNSATMYWYRVMANNSGGDSDPSNTASAETDPQPPVDPPAAPNAPTPSNGATGVDKNADLSWSGDGDTYDVYFGTSNPPPLYRTGLTTTNLNLRKLASATQYFWKVMAHNSGGSTESATVWSFAIGGGGGGGGNGGGGNGGGRGKPKK